MSVSISYLGGAGWQFFDNNGSPLTGGKLHVYQAGTTTPVTTYTSSAGTTPNANPVVLDAAGRVSEEIWLTQGALYKFVLKDSDNVEIWSKDNIAGVNDIGGVFAGPTGSSLIGFINTGSGATATTVQTVLRQIIRVTDYSNLVYTATARSPGDPASHLLPTFNCWDLAIQAAFDEADARGGGVVVLPKNTVPYYVRDLITVKSNTTFICEDWIVLADYNYVGGTFGAEGENILVQNLMIDNSNIYAGGSGYNGIGAGGKNIKFYGGMIKNCAAGYNNNQDWPGAPTAPGDGGKAVQIEAGDGEDIVIDGMTFSNCMVAMSTIRDSGTVTPYRGIIYNNITADNCRILFFVRQVGMNSTTGLEHSVQLNNFYATACGTYEGVFQFSRGNNVKISNGTVVVDPAYSATPLIRGHHADCTFENIGWYGDTTAVIDLDPSTYAPDNSYPNVNNRYNIDVWGTVAYLAYGTTGTSYNTLDGCNGNVSFRIAPTTGWFSYDMRNGQSVFNVSCNTGPYGSSKFATLFTSSNYVGSSWPEKFSELDLGNTQFVKGVAFVGGASAYDNVLDYYEQGTWTPVAGATSGSGATYTATGSYIRVGDMVTVRGSVTFTGLGTLSGRLAITGLPFPASSSDSVWLGPATARFITVANSMGLSCSTSTASYSGVTFPWTANNGGGSAELQISDLSSTTTVSFSVTYRV